MTVIVPQSRNVIRRIIHFKILLGQELFGGIPLIRFTETLYQNRVCLVVFFN